jgi:DEAD/DEAH box helicase domain-containing protein
MGENIIVFDIETKNAFGDVGGRDNLSNLGISVVGAFDYRTHEFDIFEEAELSKFADRLAKIPMLVGFNSKRFDLPILQNYIPFSLKGLPHLDIMEEIVKAVGHRVSLDSVAKATLGTKKSGSGLDAIRYFKEGRMDELKRYCLDDVKITKDVFEYGAKNGELFFESKFGQTKSVVKVGWEIKNPKDSGREDTQFKMF